MKNNLPQKFIDRTTEILSKAELDAYFAAATEPLPKTIRINKNLTETPKTWDLKPTALENMFFIDRTDRDEQALGKTLEHFTGQIYVQSLSSALPVTILNPEPTDKVLDVCSAPGSKTTFLSEKMEGVGCIIANEISSSRSKKLAANVDRLFTANVALMQYDGCRLNDFFVQEFDKILLDAPCSSEAFGRRDSNFFARMWDEKKIFEASKLQKRLITAAFEVLRPEGEMVYSTCTSAPEENEKIVQFLCSEYPGLVEILPIELPDNLPHAKGVPEFGGEKFSDDIVKNVVRIYPHLRNEFWNSEQFFCARIRKKAGIKKTPATKLFVKNPPKIYGKNQTAEVLKRFEKQWGITREHFKGKILIEKSGEVFLTTRVCALFAQKNYTKRCGVKVLDKNGNLTSYFVTAYGRFMNKNIVQFNEEQKNRFLAGFDFLVADFEFSTLPAKGSEIIARYGDHALGHFKIVQNKLKNKLDRNLIIK